MLKKYILFIILGVSFTTIHGQNLPYADQRTFHFGFSLGMSLMDCAVTPSLDNIDGEVYEVRVSSLTPGFSIGFIGDLRLTNHLNLRTTPTLHFGQRALYYKTQSSDIETPYTFKTDVVSLPISIPLYLKFSANREKNYRPYIIGGGGIMFDLGRDKERPVLLKTMDCFVEFGIGCDIYFSFFKLAPELKFSIGLNDVLTPLDQRPTIKDADKVYTQSIERLTNRMLSLVFHFE